MRSCFWMASLVFPIFALAFVALAQTTEPPNISNVTNAALPSLDYPPASLTVTPRSMATIFGTNLADTTVSIAPPWQATLGGTEVHLASDTCFDASCDLIAGLIYASPTQINFVVPSVSTSAPSASYRIVLVRNGQRLDNRSYMLGGPGRVTLDAYSNGNADVVFQVGYDCLFSYSQSASVPCGLSWSAGQYRAPLGAVTDAASGKLISSQNPVHQGQIISLWVTGLYGDLEVNAGTGLLEQWPAPLPVNFGVAKLGSDVSNVVDFGLTGPYGQFGVFQTGVPLWAGESPQYVGMDQINVAFPICSSKSPAGVEHRYDAFMQYTNPGSSTQARIYLPFLVRPGDPECGW